MDDQIPWYGGISNRQLFLDSARGLITWLAVIISLNVLLWFGADFFHLTSSTWRGACAGLSGGIAYPLVRWLRA